MTLSLILIPLSIFLLSWALGYWVARAGYSLAPPPGNLTKHRRTPRKHRGECASKSDQLVCPTCRSKVQGGRLRVR